MLSSFVCPQKLHCSQIAGLLVNLRRLRSAQRMRAICRAIEPGAIRPSMDDPGILPRRQVWLSPQTAWEQISALASVEGGEPLADSSTGLLGNLELYRPASLLLNDGRAIPDCLAGGHVIDFQPDEITASELAIYRQIEHRKIVSATFHLQPYANGPDILRLQRALLADEASSVPGYTRVGGVECSVVIVVSDAAPSSAPDQRRPAETAYPKRHDAANSDRPRPDPGMGGFDPDVWTGCRSQVRGAVGSR